MFFTFTQKPSKQVIKLINISNFYVIIFLSLELRMNYLINDKNYK
jgi:hypothetical protein